MPQGSALSPILYSIYTSDIPKGSRYTNTYIYTDDTAKVAISKEANKATEYLQQEINALEK